MHRRTLHLSLLAVAAAMLTGCSGSVGFTDLDREATATDTLPDVPAYAEVEILADSTRLVGEHEGAQLWLSQSVSDGVCLLVYPDEVDWVAGCGGAPLGVSGPAGSFVVLSDGAPPPEGAEPISENVFAQ